MAESTTRRNPGWYVGVGAFWLIAAWLVTVGLSSIIPQIFTVPAEAATATDCTPALLGERRELFARTSDSLATLGDSRDELDAWLRSWDLRVQALAESCSEPQAAAAEELLRVRYALRDTVAQLDREQGPRLAHFLSLLQRAPSEARPVSPSPAP